VAFVGYDLQDRFDDYVAYDTPASGDAVLRTYNSNAESKSVLRCVSIIKTSFGMVKLIPHTFLLTTAATGAASANTPRSGVILDMSQWCLRVRRNFRHVKLEDKGGGPRGFWDAIIGLECKDPRGQARIVCSG
jgi:hypothetical protein